MTEDTITTESTGAPRSNRELTVARLKEKYPDRELDGDDDEALFGQIGQDYDNYESELGGYKEREGKLTDLLMKDPHSAQFITDMAQGKDPWVALINRIGIDGVKEMLDDPSKLEEYAASNKDFVDRLAKSKQLEEEWSTNMGNTLAMLESKQAELGLSDEEVDAAADWIKGVLGDALIGIIKPETFDMALKALHHDADVEAAGMEGEVRGRNQRAEAKLRKPEAGDGVPMLGGANNTPAPRGGNSIFELASQA